MSEHNKEVTAEQALKAFVQKETEYLKQVNKTNAFGDIINNAFAEGVIRGMRKVIEEFDHQKIAALQSSQNFEKFSLYRETPTVATDHTVMEPSPTQEVENPDFEAYIKKLVYAFHSVGAFGFSPNNEYRWEDLWRKYRRDGILPQYNTHESNWKERLPLDEIIAAAPDLLKENQSLKERIKSLESENEELRKKGQWISVKERLPLTDDYVLITDGIEVWVGNYERSGYRGRSQWGQAFIGCSMVDDTKITHWQPLPSKP